MNNIQVQSTNDASATSKCSAVARNYFKDNFIHFFVEKTKFRAPLINLGYYVRSVILFKLIKNYVEFLISKNIFKFQIVSCGAGFDTTYWRLIEINLLSDDSVFIEIDFPNVIRRKILLMSQMKVFESLNSKCIINKIHQNIHLINHNYYLLEVDLEDLECLEKLLNYLKTDFNIPTLFLSECVITYMKEISSNTLISWMAKKFENGAFINYEQIHPDDGFGNIMLKHFEKLQSPLYSVNSYPDCASHFARYHNLGFEMSCAESEWDLFVLLTSPLERLSSFCRELFDEFEEFHNKCVHYVIGVCGNQISCSWIQSLPFLSKNLIKYKRNVIHLQQLFLTNVNLYRHCSLHSKNEKVYLIGGCNKQKRSSAVFELDFNRSANMETTNIIGSDDIQLDSVYGTVTHFEVNGNEYCCLYGGRTSPSLICNLGALLIFEITKRNWTLKYKLKDENLIPRYRSAITSLKTSQNIVDIWIFGGRSSVLSEVLPDLLRIRIKFNNESIASHEIKIYKKENENWPSSRMSHKMTASPKTPSIYVTCGLTTDYFDVLNDLWKWNCDMEVWTKLELNGKILPRYGHTCHLIKNILYIVGGVNTLAGLQPGLAIVNLEDMTVTELSIKVSGPEPVLLFNHSTEIIKRNGKLTLLILGGGGNCFSFGTYLNQGIYCLSLE